MKRAMYFILAALMLPFLALAGLSCTTKSPDLGTKGQRMRPCPDSPNCVSSEVPDVKSYVEPLSFEGTPEAAWARLRSAVEAIGGRIEEDTQEYLHATFRSRVFRFVDDLECRLDADAGVIHV